MNFCTQCGNQVEETAKFCGKCGTEIKGEETTQRVDESISNPSFNANSVQPQTHKKAEVNWKIAGIVAAILIAVIYVAVSPKQLSVEEYEDLAIRLLVADKIAQDDFGNAIEYSGVHMGLEPDWSEEYLQFVEPAQQLERDFENLRKALEDVKPPAYFEYEHGQMLKAFSAHENMAANIRTYMETGQEEYIEYSEEYESRADEYIEESIFTTEEYEDQVFEAYQSSMME